MTGRQIRDARHMLGWSLDEVSSRSHVPASAIGVAELADQLRGMTLYQAGLVQQAFERVGIHFGRNGAVLMTASMQR